MTENRPFQIVCAYDFSGSGEYALERAVVAALEPQRVLHVVVAITRGGMTDRAVEAINERVSDAFAEHVAENATPEFYVHARIGRPADEILGLARDIGADLIFIGSHGKVGVQRLLLGSVSERVVREARCPVMVVRAKTYEDVDLVKVVPFEHERTPYSPPRRYGHGDRRVIVHPTDWPLG